MTSRRYRRAARFVADARQHSRRLNPKERARIMMRARELERDTQIKGKPNGVLGWVGLKVLHELLFTFHNKATGLTCPTYVELMKATGLSKQAVAAGLARLEAASILRITRRLVRVVVEIAGQAVTATQQGSNLYLMQEPPAAAWGLPVTPAKPRSFGRPAFAALARLLGWAESTEQGETNLKNKKGGLAEGDWNGGSGLMPIAA